MLGKIASLLVVVVGVFVSHILISTGFFRSITPYLEGQITKEVALYGAEDITISESDSFAIVSATNRRYSSPPFQEENGLYFIDLKDDDYQPVLLTGDLKIPFSPHGIHLLKVDSNYQIMAINHTSNGHSIEVFGLLGDKLNFKKSITHNSLISPNDIVQIDKNRFYFTNDHGHTRGFKKVIEEYSGASWSNVVYFDGSDFMEVANKIAYANGINFDKNRNLLFVASPRKFLVKVYSRKQNGSLEFIEDIPCLTGVDNIEFDANGELWIGSHPNLLRFSAYAAGKKEIAPSEIIKIAYRKKGDFNIEKIYVEDGSTMSASTVAAPFGDVILTGNVMDSKFLVLELD